MKRSMIYFLVFTLMITMLNSCLTKKKDIREVDDFDLWLLETQEQTNKGRYNKAIELLNEMIVKFPDESIIAIEYNIGFNYYKLVNYDMARKYFNKVISSFENNNTMSKIQIEENQKYIVLANKLLEQIDLEIEQKKDPYHIQEDLEKMKKKKAKVK